MNLIGRSFIFIGLLFILIGVFLLFGEKISRAPFLNKLGKLPGDIRIEKPNFVFFFPVTTCIVLSIILSLILYFLSKK